MLRRMGLGLCFALVSLILNMLPFLSITWKGFFYQMLIGISYVLVNPVSLEFTVAQSPVQCRGVMVGMWYASFQIGSTLSFFISLCHDHGICSSFYCYLTKTVLLLIILIVFVVLAKRYKYRVRENDVNIYQIADNTYHNYIRQEAEYNQENSIDNNSISNS